MKKKLMLAAAIAALWIIYIILLKTIDVAPIGPEGTSVGFSTTNGAVHNLLDFNSTWYTISKLFGYAVIACAGAFGAVGIYHIFKKKGLANAEPVVLATFGLYFMFAVIYLLFELFIVNYRPVIMPGDEHVEASFPSSHSMLAVIVMGSFYLMTQRYVRNEKAKRIIRILCIILMAGTILTRLLAGVHWHTDIVGGVWIGIALIAAFDGILDLCDLKRKRKRRKKKKAHPLETSEA